MAEQKGSETKGKKNRGNLIKMEEINPKNNSACPRLEPRPNARKSTSIPATSHAKDEEIM